MNLSHAALLALTFGCLPPRQPMPDAVVLRNGDRRPGRIEGLLDGHILLLTRPVPELASVTLRIPESRIQSLEFGADPERNSVLQGGAPRIEDLEALWKGLNPFLAVKTAPSARIGLKFGFRLLESPTPQNISKARSTFELIAQNAVLSEEREAAQQGLLRALRSANQPAEARAEALRHLKSVCGGELKNEAALTIAEISEADLRRCLETHPRWEQEVHGPGQRDLIFHDSLDHYLMAALIPNAPTGPAQRGWLGALRLYELVGDRKNAEETARTILELHPGSPCAELAQKSLRLNLSTEKKRGDSTDKNTESKHVENLDVQTR